MKYQKMTAEQAASMINNGDTLSFSGFTTAGTPRVISTALAERAKAEHEAGRPFKVSIFTGASSSTALDGALSDALAIDRRAPYQSTPSFRKHINSNELNYFDMHLSMLAQYVRYGFLGDIDYLIIDAIDITDDGEVTLGGGVGNVAAFAEKAKHIFIELNSQFPKAMKGIHDVYAPKNPPYRREIPIYDPSDHIGSPVLKIDPAKVLGVVDCCYHYGTKPFTALDDVTEKIGENVVKFLIGELEAGRIPKEFLPLQSGVGNVANAVLQGLLTSDKIPPFKMYTEVLQDSVIDLIDAGKCTYASSSSLTLSDETFDKVAANIEFYKKHIVLRPVEISNSPEVIRRLGVISLNTALEADIFGNVNSTHVLGTKMMNGIGGSADFTRNAYISIFSCPSVAKGGCISAIVPFASHIDNSEHSVMVLITEQGIADLRGKSPRQRAECIIENCVHPEYRQKLREYLDMCPNDGPHTPHTLRCALAFHEEFMKSGDMRNVNWNEY